MTLTRQTTRDTPSLHRSATHPWSLLREHSRLTLGLVVALATGLLLAWLPLADAAILLALTTLAVGTLFEPLTGLVGGLFLGLMRAYLQAEVPYIPPQIGHLFIGLAAAAWTAQKLGRRNLRFACRPPLAPLLLFIGAAWLSLWNPADPANYGLQEFAKWIEVLLVFLIVADRTSPRHLPWLVGAVLLIGVFQAGVGFYQFALWDGGPEHFLIPGSDLYRAFGTFEQPNPYAGYLGLTASLATGLFLTGVRNKQTPSSPPTRRLLPTGAVALLLLAALGMSWSRGAWIGFAAALMVMVFALPHRTRRGILLVGLSASLVVALNAAGLLPPTLVARLTDFAASLRLTDVRGVGINDANYAVLERLAHWQSALEMWRTNFWTGVGLGCYEPAYPHFALVNWPLALGHAHNIYLNMLAETGLMGAAAYLVFWGAVFWQTWRATRRTTGMARGLAVGMLGTWTHLSVHQLFDNLYVNNVHLLIGLLLGLLASITDPTNQ